jgi:hypothetical protein
MPDLIRHPVIPLDSGLRRNDKCGVFNCRFNIMAAMVSMSSIAAAEDEAGGTPPPRQLH